MVPFSRRIVGEFSITIYTFALAAEIERNLISQRTKEALAVRKLRGMKLGRPPGSSKKKVLFCKNKEDIVMMLNEGKSCTDVARSLGIHRNTLRKYLYQEENNEKNKLFYLTNIKLNLKVHLKILMLFLFHLTILNQVTD